MGVLYEKKGNIAYITINNTEKANLLDRAASRKHTTSLSNAGPNLVPYAMRESTIITGW